MLVRHYILEIPYHYDTYMWRAETEIRIDAEAEDVWEVLTRLDDYARWNPYSRVLSGELKLGGVVTIEAKLGDEVQRVSNRVLCLQSPHVLSWRSCNWYSFLARGTRSRHIEPLPGGGVRFRQIEEMRGPLAGYVGRAYRSRIEAGQNAENAALKIEAEKRASARRSR